MQFGVNLPCYWSDYGTSSMQEAIEETAKAAEALGYVSAWANDHILVPANSGRSGVQIEPLITLASLIHLAPALTFGTSVLVLPQRDAILVAKQAAALDLLSGGRFILGLGVGWNEQEFAYHGADFARRGAVADEAIAVIRTLWQEQEASFQGRFYRFANALFYPKPLGQGPPLWIGGSSRAALQRAARYGDAWIPFGASVDTYREGVAVLDAFADGRPRPRLALHLSLRILSQNRSAGSADSGTHLVGSVDEIVDTLAAYQRLGLADLVCLFRADTLSDLLEQMQIFTESIAPHLR